MKILTFAAVFVAVAAIAGATSVVRTLPATAVDDAAGIAYTQSLHLGRFWRNDPDEHYTGSTFNGSVLVDVRGAVDKLGLQSGTWDARLSCPSPVGKRGAETFARSGVSLSDGVTFAVSIATASHDGLHRQSYRCWLRVKIGLPEDGTTIVIRDAMLPVDVTHAQHLAD